MFYKHLLFFKMFIANCQLMIIDDDICFDEGVSGKMSTETAHDDDNFGTESSQKVIGPNNHHSQLIYNKIEFCMCYGCFDFFLSFYRKSTHEPSRWI